MFEEFYDLQKDPLEQNNLIDKMKMHAPRWLQMMREVCNDNYRELDLGLKRREMPEEEKKAIAERLRRLGYTQ
jgi:uncharacterized protein YjiS (DUF1127 family)